MEGPGQEAYEEGMRRTLDPEGYEDPGLKSSHLSLGEMSTVSVTDVELEATGSRRLLSQQDTHEGYVELHELVLDNAKDLCWMEAGHWLKLEEDFQESGDWSQPHLSFLTYHSLLEIRRALNKGAILLGVEATSLPAIVHILLDQLIYEGQLKPQDRDDVMRTLLLRHGHPTEDESVWTMPPALVQRSGSSRTDVERPLLREQRPMEMSRMAGKEQVSGDRGGVPKPQLLETIPEGAEATLVLVGCAAFLEQPVLAFVRLKEAVTMDGVLDVSIPVRFLVVVLGPDSPQISYHEIGRAIATMMSERVFRRDAYLAEARQDLLRGVEDFLDASIVLPPAEAPSEPLLRALVPLQQELLRRRYQPLERLHIGDFLKDLGTPGGPPRPPVPAAGGQTVGCRQGRESPGAFSPFPGVSQLVRPLPVLPILCSVIRASLCRGILGHTCPSPLHHRALALSPLPKPHRKSTLKTPPAQPALSSRPHPAPGSHPEPTGKVPPRQGGAGIPIPTLPHSLLFPPQIFKDQIFKDHPLQRRYDVQDEYQRGVPEPNTALLSLVLMAGTFFLAFFLRKFKNSSFLPGKVRRLIGDFGVPISIFIMALADFFISDTYTQKLSVPKGLQVTNATARSWFIQPMGEKKPFPIWMMFASVIPALLVFILIFLETQITTLIVSKPERKLVKGTGFHLDLLLIVAMGGLAALFGMPWLSATTVRTITHANALTIMSKTSAQGEKSQILEVKEQRISGLLVAVLIGVSILMEPILKYIPLAVLFGIFLYMGVTSLFGIQLFDRILLLLKPPKYHPDEPYVTRVKTWRMHLFTFTQIVFLVVLWVVKSTPASLALPFVLILTVPLRRFLLPRIFRDIELKCLDADDAVVTFDEAEGTDVYNEVQMPS
uniref:Anion exchange protein n=1 Tax=Ficedula albicollis TaxID=59894 RepID=U3JQN7_FICAL